MTTFIVLATLLIVVAATLLARPLLRPPRSAPEIADRQAANIAILRDQMAELEHERSEGSLTEADFEQARKELQRRLLEEARPEAQPSREAAPSRKTALIVMLLLPLVALGGYGLLGNPKALDPAARQPAPKVTAADIENMVARLAARLQANPDDPKGWVMLARSYKALGRYPEAAEAYGKGMAVVENDAELLADYAELLAITSDGFRGKPTELLDRALKLAPEDPQVLLLAGAAAGERGDFGKAVIYWEKVLPLMDPGSEEAEALGAALAQAREAAKKGKPSAVPGPRISGEVSLHPKLADKVGANDILFIFARAEGGKGMPLAAIRLPAGKLPQRFSLDDSMALGEDRLSAHKTVTIEARIARAGTAQISSGDLFARRTGVKPGTQDVRLVIDQVVP